MTKVKVTSLQNSIELNLPYMFANPALIEKKVNINGIIDVMNIIFSFLEEILGHHKWK